MTINIRAINMELTPAIRQYVEEKMNMLDKYAHGIMHIDVDLGKETQHHNKGKVFSCAVIVNLGGDVLKVERNEEDLYKSIDKVKDHLRETLAQRKERGLDQRKS